MKSKKKRYILTNEKNFIRLKKLNFSRVRFIKYKNIPNVVLKLNLTNINTIKQILDDNEIEILRISGTYLQKLNNGMQGNCTKHYCSYKHSNFSSVKFFPFTRFSTIFTTSKITIVTTSI